METSALLIAICGGHRSSTAVAWNTQWRAVQCIQGPSLTLHTLHPDKLGERIDEILVQLAEQSDSESDVLLRDCASLVIALPGIATDYDRHSVELALNSIGWDRPEALYLLDDTDCGLFGGAIRGSGICAIANTGASVLAVDNFGTRHKYDGWGAVIGDFGSGFEVAQSLFRHLNRKRFDKTPPQIFEDLREYLHDHEHPHVNSLADIQNWFDTICRDYPAEWRSIFGGTASVVTAAARRDPADETALAILSASANNMADTITIAHRSHPSLAGQPVVCQGAMFEFSAFYRELVFQRVIDAIGVCPQLGKYRPVVGALLYGAGNGRFPADNLTVNALLSAVDRSTEYRALLRPDLRGLIE